MVIGGDWWWLVVTGGEWRRVVASGGEWRRVVSVTLVLVRNYVWGRSAIDIRASVSAPSSMALDGIPCARSTDGRANGPGATVMQYTTGAIVKILAPTRAGNEERGQENIAHHRNRVSVVEMVRSIDDHLNVLHEMAMERQCNAELSLNAPDDEMLRGATTPSSIDEPYLIEWLAQHIKLSVRDILHAKIKDPHAAYQLLAFAMPGWLASLAFHGWHEAQECVQRHAGVPPQLVRQSLEGS